MNRAGIIKGLTELGLEFNKYDSIECKPEDVELISSAIKELSNNEADIINSLQEANAMKKEENDLLREENQKLSKELEVYKWAFEGLKRAYFTK